MNAIRVTAAPFAFLPRQRGLGARLILLRRKVALLLRARLLEARRPQRPGAPEPSETPEEEPTGPSIDDYWNDPAFWMCIMPH